MTTKKTMTRTIRLAIAAAAILALTAQAAQAKPLEPIAAAPHVSAAQPAPASPAGHVAFWRDRDARIAAQTATAQTSGTGFDWVAATVGAGATLVVVLIAGAGIAARGRRRVPLSA
jgi:hypothetical protein